MSKWATFGKAVLGGLLGMALGLFLWGAYGEYRDFRAMRVWVAQMQQLQADAAKAQQKAPAQAPAEAPK